MSCSPINQIGDAGLTGTGGGVQSGSGGGNSGSSQSVNGTINGAPFVALSAGVERQMGRCLFVIGESQRTCNPLGPTPIVSTGKRAIMFSIDSSDGGDSCTPGTYAIGQAQFALGRESGCSCSDGGTQTVYGAGYVCEARVIAQATKSSTVTIGSSSNGISGTFSGEFAGSPVSITFSNIPLCSLFVNSLSLQAGIGVSCSE
jgi:hypothetical protein